MLQVPFSEKIEVLMKIISSSIFPIISLIIICFIGFLFLTTNRNNEKESKKVFVLIYIACFIALGIEFSNILGSLANYLLDNIFIQIYFPNLVIYIVGIIISNLIMWKTLFKSTNKGLKIINTIVYCLLHYLLILTISVISSKNLDIFEVTALYQNKQALALIELSSALFVLWLFFLAIYSIVKKFQPKEKGLILDEVPATIKVNVEKKIREVPAPHQVMIQKKTFKEENKIQEEKEIPTPVEENNLYDLLTIEDYKLLLALLKNQKSYQPKKKEAKKEINAVYHGIR